MQVIGVCGGSGSGKGEVCRLFGALSIPSVDTDALYHSMIAGPSELTAALSLRFGQGILTEKGGIDRARLASLVFAQGAEGELSDLNRISHLHILNEVRKWLEKMRSQGCRAALVDAPLLFESGFDRECDAVLCVTAPEALRIARIMQRDGITEQQARVRISKQKSDAFLLQRSRYHIENAGDTVALQERVKEVAQKILNDSEV